MLDFIDWSMCFGERGPSCFQKLFEDNALQTGGGSLMDGIKSAKAKLKESNWGKYVMIIHKGQLKMFSVA